MNILANIIWINVAIFVFVIALIALVGVAAVLKAIFELISDKFNDFSNYLEKLVNNDDRGTK